jgi:hypothetical protein
MSEQLIAGYKLSQLRAVPVGADTALVTYFADIKTPGNEVEFPMAVGEVWVKRNGQRQMRAHSGASKKWTAGTAATASMSRPSLRPKTHPCLNQPRKDGAPGGIQNHHDSRSVRYPPRV